MAKIENKNPNCVAGQLFVDTSCIDCWTCYHIAPDIFKPDNNSQCFIANQPQDENQWKMVKEALLSCPVNSIGVRDMNLNDIESTLPRKIKEEIYYCGYTSKDSYGASSYLITNPLGNILVDSPRFNSKLVSTIESLGGVRYMLLTHKDDVADHQKFQKHFNCQRIIHQFEIEEGTKDCEIILQDEKNYHLFEDVEILFSPGHSKGHLLLLYKGINLFSGDQLFYDHINDKLYASKSLNWCSWEQQINSLKKLVQHRLEWIFPGHGGWCNKSPSQIQNEILSL